MVRKHMFAVALTAGSLACGGTQGRPDGLRPAANAYCDALCAYWNRCDVRGSCSASCYTFPRHRDEALYLGIECIRDHACGGADELVGQVCLDEVASRLDARPVDDAYLAACTVKLEACGDAIEDGPGQPSPCYGWTRLFVEDAVEDATACFAETCDSVRTCLQSH